MKSNPNKELRASSLCEGYGVGVTCIGCCHTYGPCSEIYELIEPPIYIGIRNCPYATKSNGSPINEVWIAQPAPPFASFEPYMNGSVRVEGNFSKSQIKLMDIVQKNTTSFQTNLNNKTSLEEVSKLGKLIGSVNGNIGCLIYSHKNPDQESFYRPNICQSYLCPIINYAKFSGARNGSMKKFIIENLGNEKFNTLSLSRVIHLLGYHLRVVKALGIDVNFDKSPKENLPGLNKLLEIVSR